ncbi:MAG: RNA-binding protein [Gammaproteobacteria bacterium]|nr:MAG: RNA-binding protein [Gammaproteobacteria bacterium]
MIVFIGNLPADITANEITALAQLAAGNAVRIYKKQDGSGSRYRYGLVHMESEREGRKLIRRLQKIAVRGYSLQAREFRDRRVINERRRLDWRIVPWNGPERRRGERRVAD